jgi:aryl-alcohol dehydrogenase-like predicted oxidoreductase
VLRACRELGVTLMAYSPLAMGLLGGRYDPVAGRLPRRLRRYLTGGRAETIAALLRRLKEIAAAHGRTPAQVALNWLLRQPGLMAIPGAKTARQAEENAGALGWSLTDAEAAALDQASAHGPAPPS